MSTLHQLIPTIAAEPATVLYLLTGGFAFGWARLTRRRRRKSTMMLICQRRSRMAMDSLDLFQ
jgi:hypothetical protein